MSINLYTNYFRLRIGEGEVSQYHMDVEPEVHSRRLSFKILKTLPQYESFGVVINDGGLIFSKQRFPNVLSETVEVFGNKYTVTIKFTNTLSITDLPPSAAQLFNIILRRCYRELGVVPVHRNFFDPASKISVPKYNLDIWPGFSSSIQNLQGGVMLNTDLCRKVVRKDTALQIIDRAMSAKSSNAEKTAQNLLCGMIVLTHYNNRTYKIKEIDFSRTPKVTFEDKKNKRQISLLEYYEVKYHVKISDSRQPLLIAEGKKGDTKEILLVPELCRMTGLTDEMTSDFQLMRAVAEHTRIPPNKRLEAHAEFRKGLDAPGVAKNMNEWGMQIAPSLLRLTGKQLEPQVLMAGTKEIRVDAAKGDWKLQSLAPEKGISLPASRWLLVHHERSNEAKENLLRNLMRVAQGMNLRFEDPLIRSVRDDSPDAFINAIDSSVNPSFLLVVCLFPNPKKERYDAVKHFLCTKKPLPCQCVLEKTIMKNPSNLSVATKICHQLQVKCGGELWKVKVPLTGAMIVGIDVYHDTLRKGTSVLAFCATINASYNRYFSCPCFQSSGQEIADSLSRCMTDALEAYKKENQTYPKHIIVYRDGVGLGQLPAVKALEIPQLKRSFASIPNFSPSLVFIVVTKKINTRFITQNQSNPPPGTVVDQQIVRPNVTEFFLVAQHVNQGTASPTHYEVLENSLPLTPEQIQILTFKLCHTYFNWTGTVRVPSPCQYAHKLAFLIGQSVHQSVHARLSSFLYFL